VIAVGNDLKITLKNICEESISRRAFPTVFGDSAGDFFIFSVVSRTCDNSR
jgi:hypothetical protein